MRTIILLLISFTILTASCKKKNPFKIEVKSAAFTDGAEIFDNGISEFNLNLRDAAEGFGEAVKISIEGLPPQMATRIYPDSSLIVTDAGANIYISITSKKAVLNAIYPIILKFEWKGGSTTREIKLRIVPYNAAKALTGKYLAQGTCDTNNGQNEYESMVELDTGIHRIKIRNWGNISDEFIISAIVDSTTKQITVPQQTINGIKVQGDGNYGPMLIMLGCTITYPGRSYFCAVQLGRITE